MLMVCFFTVNYFYEESRQVVKYAYHPITNLCFRKTKAITAPTPNFAFVLLHSFEGTDRICEIIKSF